MTTRSLVKLSTVALVFCCLTASALPARAEGEPFAIRFGILALSPTSDTTIPGGAGGATRVELDDAFGFEFDFEWYFAKRWGLEGSILTAIDADVDVDESGPDDVTTADGLTVTPLTVGINWHAIRSTQVDWSIGAVAGPIYYGNFDYTNTDNSTTTNVETDDDFTYGIQTAVDLNVSKQGRWAVNVGLKYLLAEFDTNLVSGGNTRTGKVEIDPIILRVMGVFRFGGS